MTDLNKYYKETSVNFDSIRFDDFSEIKDHCEWFLEGVESNRQNTLLDIGCGTGRYTHFFLDKNILVVGIDKSSSQIEIANLRIPSMLMDALDLKFPQNSFNIVSLIMMIQQLDVNDLRSLFQAIRDVLQSSGKVWIKTCSHLDLKRRPFNDITPSALKVNLSRYPSVSKILTVASSAGFFLNRELNVVNGFSLSGKDLLRRFELKHNSTLHLIPESEYLNSINIIKEKYSSDIMYRFQHYHTLIELIKL